MLNEFFYNTTGDTPGPGPGPEPEAYVINRSLRFNSEDSAYLNWKPEAEGNRRTWTWSGWIKKSEVSATGTSALFFAGVNTNGNAVSYIYFNSNDTLTFTGGVNGVSTDYNLVTTQVFRDPSSWYHLVFTFDTSEAVESERLRIYVNGDRVNDFSSSSYPPVNYEGATNSTAQHTIGSIETAAYLNGYLAEVYFIDGQSLSASDFGAYDDNGVWQPKKFTGVYTPGVIYTDTLSGVNDTEPVVNAQNAFDGSLDNNAYTDNGIRFTPIGGSQSDVTSLRFYSQSFGQGGTIKLNGAVVESDYDFGSGSWYAFSTADLESISNTLTSFEWDRSPGSNSNTPDYVFAIEINGVILQNSNDGINSFYLDFNDTSSNGALGYDKSEIVSTRAQSGFNIVEWTGNGGTQSIESVGFQPDFLWIKGTQRTTDHYLQDSVRGATITSDSNNDGNETNNPDGVVSLDPSGFTVGPGTGFNASNVTNEPYIAWCWKAGGLAQTINPGDANSSAYDQSEVWSDRITFSGGTLTPGSEVTAFDGDLTTGITDGNNASGTPLLMTFDPPITATTSLRVFTTGTGSTPVKVNGVVFANSSPGAWDTISGNVINTVEVNHRSGVGLSRLRAVEVDGKILVNTSLTPVNGLPSLASEVSANTEYGFSVVSYTGNGTIGATFAHGLNAKPGLIFVKGRDTSDNWVVYHSSLGATKFLWLNSSDSAFTGINRWNNTEPTSSVVTLYSDSSVNQSSSDYFAYCWSEVSGYSKFGSYTGNGATQKLTFGFTPAYILFKRIDSADDWYIIDNKRVEGNGEKILRANTEQVQEPAYDYITNTPDGIILNTGNTLNGSGRQYIYAAFAQSVGNNWEVNNLVANAIGDPKANKNMDVVTYTGNGGTQTINGFQFEPGLLWIKARSQPYSHRLFDQVRGLDALYSDASSPENANAINENLISYNSDGFTLGPTSSTDALNNNGVTMVAWAWKAGDETQSNTDGTIASTVSANPEYGFSIVTYTGAGSNATVGHGLSSAPKLVLYKSRGDGNDWMVYHTSMGATKSMLLNSSGAEASRSDTFNNTEPTNAVLHIGSSGTTSNTNSPYMVAYCWSEVSGYSKFGSYSGGTNSQTIATGFKPRFLIIKRTDSANQWIMIDSLRGGNKKVAANDSALENNLATVGDDSQNVVEFLGNGFKLKTTNAGTNASGGTYIYAAFAGIPEGEDVDSLIDTPTNYQTAIVPVEVDVPGFAAVTYTGNGTTQDIDCGFQPDLVWLKKRNNSANHMLFDSVRGAGTVLYSNSSSLEQPAAISLTSFNSDGFSLGNASEANNSGDTFVAWCWKAGNTTQTIAAGDANSSAYNQSQVWSSNVSGGSMLISWTKAFDGNVSPSSAAQTGGNSSTVTLNPPIEVGSGVEIAGASGAFVTFGLVDGSSVTDKPDDYSTFSPVDGLNSGQIETISLNAFQALSGIKVDGKILVDSGASPPNVNSVDSQVSVSPEYGFSVITGVQPGTANLGCTVAHGLEKAPSMYIVKDRDLGVGWGVYHSGLDDPANEALALNSDGQVIAGGYWRGELPTSDVLSISASIVAENDDFVVYAWSEIEGFSKFGSYEGNGQVNGPVIETGFKPAFILLKDAVRSSKRWIIWDTSRDPSGNLDKGLSPNLADAEVTGFQGVVLENGFQITDEESTLNQAGDTYIYAAFGKGFTEIVDTQPDNNGGNYATLNPLSAGTNAVLANGNLEWSTTATSNLIAQSTIAVSSGKWYCEYTATSGNNMVGIQRADGAVSSSYVGGNADSWGYYGSNGNKYNNNSAAAYGGSYTTNDIIGIALDVDAGTLTFYKNGTSQGQAYSGLTNGPYTFATGNGANVSGLFNFGQRPFAYAPPAGYKSLCTTNLNEPTIADGSTAMDVVTYTGNGTSQTITGLNISPDLVWIKERSSASGHGLFDIVRGTGLRLRSDAAFTETSGGLTAFNSDGFAVDTDTALNENNQTYVGWTWEAGNETETIAPGGANAAVYQMREIWSDHLTSPGDVKKATAAFDGVIDGSRTEGVGGLTLTPPGGLQVYSSVEVIDAQGITESQVTINGVVQPFVEHTGNTWVTIFSGSGTLDSIFTRRTDNPAFDAGYTGVRVDGRELINTDITPPVNYPSISSEVRANPAAGFSIVSYTGITTAGSIGHGLGAAPSLIITKSRSNAQSWGVYHIDVGIDKYLLLDSTASTVSNSGIWGSSAPTSTVFSVPGNVGLNNFNAWNYVAYCFAPVEGYSAFGSYTGNGSTDGPFVYTGFRPRWLMIKKSTATGSWAIIDAVRGSYNITTGSLFAESTNAEDTRGFLDILSNGFKITSTIGDVNQSGQTHLVAAFAEHPFKTSRAR